MVTIGFGSATDMFALTERYHACSLRRSLPASPGLSITCRAPPMRRITQRRSGSRRSATCTCSTKAGTKCRETIFANQKKLGIMPENAQLTPWPDGQEAYGGAKLPKWELAQLG